MKTLQEMYNEIIADEELKKAFLEAAENGKIVEFAQAQGCEASPEEITAFAEKAMGKTSENGVLSDEELENVAGGCGSKKQQKFVYCEHCGYFNYYSPGESKPTMCSKCHMPLITRMPPYHPVI